MAVVEARALRAEYKSRLQDTTRLRSCSLVDPGSLSRSDLVASHFGIVIALEFGRLGSSYELIVRLFCELFLVAVLIWLGWTKSFHDRIDQIRGVEPTPAPQQAQVRQTTTADATTTTTTAPAPAVYSPLRGPGVLPLRRAATGCGTRLIAIRSIVPLTRRRFFGATSSATIRPELLDRRPRRAPFHQRHSAARDVAVEVRGQRTEVSSRRSEVSSQWCSQ